MLKIGIGIAIGIAIEKLRSDTESDTDSDIELKSPMNPTNPTNSKIRTFIALELPDQARSDINDLQKQLTSAGLKLRWVKPLNIHLTLKFMGDVDSNKLDPICDSVASAVSPHKAFDLQPRGIGCFPGLKNPRVFWVGLSGEVDILGSLQTDVENALIPLGFKAEKRPFRGHLTIGRTKKRLNPLKTAEALRAHSAFSSDVFTVNQVTVFGSKLQPAGPVYTKLYQSPLSIP